VRRLLRVSSLAFASILFTLLFSSYISRVDQQFFSVVVKSCNEFFAVDLQLNSFNLDGGASFLVRFLGLSLFSLGAVWTGFLLNPAGKIVLTVQLTFFSLIFQWLTWRLFGAPGAPLSYFVCILSALALGSLRKHMDRTAARSEAQKVELQLRNQEILDSRILLVKQDEMERRLLAADLHDQVLNDLKNVLRSIQANEEAPNSVSTREICESINEVMQEVRLIMDNLCPYSLEHFGLGAALEEVLEKSAKKGGFKVRFKQSCGKELLASLSQVDQQLIYRLVQESLTNIVKHAQAKVVRVEVEQDHDQIVFRIRDDGQGFDLTRVGGASRGLTYMQLRAALIGGSVSWQSEIGKGTTAEIRVSASAG
jgi:signal transduction histidine kinase